MKYNSLQFLLHCRLHNPVTNTIKISSLWEKIDLKPSKTKVIKFWKALKKNTNRSTQGSKFSYRCYLCHDKYDRICTNMITYTSQEAAVEVHYINLQMITPKFRNQIKQYKHATLRWLKQPTLQDNYQFHNKGLLMAQMRKLLPKLLRRDKLFSTRIASISANCGDHMPVRQKPAPPANHSL